MTPSEGKVILTKRGEKEKAGAKEATSAPPVVSKLADGKWLYLKMPAGLREKGREPTLRQVLEALEEIMDLKDVESAGAHDSKGWMVHCRSREAMEAAKNLAIYIKDLTKEHEIRTVAYHAGGPQVFITARSSPGATNYHALAIQIARVKEL